MNHIIILTHGDFCQGIAQSCRFILGDAADLHTISIRMDTAMDAVIKALHEEVSGIGEEPVIVATDIPGGSTTQAALRVLPEHANMYLVSGLNLGLLLELAMMDLTEDREENLGMIREAVEEMKEQLVLLNDTMSAAANADNEDDGEL